MKSYRKELWFEAPTRRALINITPQVTACLAELSAEIPFILFSSDLVFDGRRGNYTEDDPPNPVGEYGMSALGRERVFEHVSRTYGTPVALVRLNYACDLRYGVLVDIARRVRAGEPIDLGMGYFNTIWQGDANATTLRAFDHVASPPWVVNVTGPETLAVRDVAERFARRFGRPRVFLPARGAFARGPTFRPWCHCLPRTATNPAVRDGPCRRSG